MRAMEFIHYNWGETAALMASPLVADRSNLKMVKISQARPTNDCL